MPQFLLAVGVTSYCPHSDHLFSLSSQKQKCQRISNAHYCNTWNHDCWRILLYFVNWLDVRLYHYIHHEANDILVKWVEKFNTGSCFVLFSIAVSCSRFMLISEMVTREVLSDKNKGSVYWMTASVKEIFWEVCVGSKWFDLILKLSSCSVLLHSAVWFWQQGGLFSRSLNSERTI